MVKVLHLLSLKTNKVKVRLTFYQLTKSPFIKCRLSLKTEVPNLCSAEP